MNKSAGGKFLRHLSKTTDLNEPTAIVQDSPSISVEPDVVLFQKIQDSEQSDKVLCLRAATSESHSSCSTSRFLFV